MIDEHPLLLLSDGLHPLSAIAGEPIPLHPEAAPDNGDAAGLRCGTCRYRHVVNGNPVAAYPKCLAGGPPFPRASHGASSDCMRWWPACVDHEYLR